MQLPCMTLFILFSSDLVMLQYLLEYCVSYYILLLHHSGDLVMLHIIYFC